MLHLRIFCSKGAYIRALARDIGKDLGVGGCVSSLRRIATGVWDATMMRPFDAIETQPLEALHPIQTWLHGWSEIYLDAAEAKRFVQGQRLAMKQHPTGQVTVVFNGVLLGIGKMEERGDYSVLHPKNVLPSAQQMLQK
jgi:tRNA pseudouridine55 synthase